MLPSVTRNHSRCAVQFARQTLLLRDVTRNLGDADQHARCRRIGETDSEMSTRRPSFVRTNRLEMLDSLPAPNSGKDLIFLGLATRWDELSNRLADKLLGLVSK